MKKSLLLLCISLAGHFCFSQSYTLSPTNLNVNGNPGDLMYATLVVNNTGANTISIHVERIARNLPPNWSTCFCFPFCVAPFIDTLTFTIQGYSSDSIKPSFLTDSLVPGIGYVSIRLFQLDYPNNPDTVSFSGSTLSSSSMNESTLAGNVTVFPNPFTHCLTVQNKNREAFSFSIYNSTGQVLFKKEQCSAFAEILDLSYLAEGIYFTRMEFLSGKVEVKRIVKTKM